MSESDLDKVLEECKSLVSQLKTSDDHASDLLRQASKLIQKQRMILNQKWFLEDVFDDCNDGVQRRRLLEEFNDEYYKTELFMERNSTMTDNLSECMEMVKEIHERHRILVSACQKEDQLLREYSLRSESGGEEDDGYAHAEAKEVMRKLADYVENVLKAGHAEMLGYFEQYVQDRTYVKGNKETFSPAESREFNELAKEGRAYLATLFEKEALVNQDSESDPQVSTIRKKHDPAQQNDQDESNITIREA